MERDSLDNQLILSDPAIWTTPHVVQCIRQGNVRWDEYLKTLVADLSLGVSGTGWIHQLLREGNIGLAMDYAEETGILVEVKTECLSQETDWQQMLHLAHVELEEYAREQADEIGEIERDESNELWRLAEEYAKQRAYGEAVSAAEQARQVLERAVNHRRAIQRQAIETAEDKLKQARRLFLESRQSHFPGGELAWSRAKSLLLEADKMLLGREFSRVMQLADWVEMLCTGKEVSSSEIEEILSRGLVVEGEQREEESLPEPDESDAAEVPQFEFDWTRENDEYLIDNYEVMSIGQLKLRFHASTKELEDRIRYLGLVHDRESHKKVVWRNPYVAGKPIRDKRVFVGREDVFNFIRDGLAPGSDGADAGDRNLIALIGHRRTGKTSLLLQLKRNRREVISPRIPVFIDFEGLLPFPGGLRNFFYKLAHRIWQELTDEEFELPEPQEDDYKDPSWRFQEFLRRAERVIGGQGLVLMMDEFHAIEPRHSSLDVDVYKMLRSVIQHDTHVDFIIAGTLEMERLIREHKAAMFGSAIRKRIDFLEEKDARKLIVTPIRNYVTYSKEAEDLIIEITACHPYFVQLVCWTLMRHLIDRGKTKVFASDVERVLPQVIEQGVHFDEIWATETTDLELYLMAVLGELTTTGRGWCSLSRIEERLRWENRLPENLEDLFEAIGNLTNRRILRHSDDGSEIAFQVAMFGQWVRTNKPVAVVNRDIQAKAAQERRRIERLPKTR